jgi:hypothetical protein
VQNGNFYRLCTLNDTAHKLQSWTNCHENVQSGIIRSLFVTDEKQSRPEDTWVWRSRSSEWNSHYRLENGADKKRVSLHVGIPLNTNILKIWCFWLLKWRKFHMQGTKLLEVKKMTFSSHQTRSGDYSRRLKIKKKTFFPYCKRHRLKKKTHN